MVSVGPSTAPKRAWKLQEFVAHSASVNCVALGHKSGRVLVTGSDDKKVNLWAIGKPNCIMSLCGHTTAIECVRFSQTEDLLVAGSASGALKIWDLEAARLLRTLTGHKAGLTCVDFHPYGDFLASGSVDKNLKLWDIRRKGCIFTYKGHCNRINSLKFSPDGQWIASAGEDAAVKMWDLRAGKLISEFGQQGGPPVHDVEFHPHEFLLASASQDRTVSFWDLESFTQISTSERDSGPVSCIIFHPEGNVLFSGSHDSLKVNQWEPTPTICDSQCMGWAKVRDMAVASTQLIGVSYNMSNVSIYVVDLKRVQPFGVDVNASIRGSVTGFSGATPVQQGTLSRQEQQQQQFRRPAGVIRKSFIKEKPVSKGQGASSRSDVVKMAEDHASSDRSGTDPEDSDAQASINDIKNYEHIFKPRRRELNRTPTPPDVEDDEDNEPFKRPSPPCTVSDNSIVRPSDLMLRGGVSQKNKSQSPNSTRRKSQSVLMHSSSPVRLRKGSSTNLVTSTNVTSQSRPLSEGATMLTNVSTCNKNVPISYGGGASPTRSEVAFVSDRHHPHHQLSGTPPRSSSLNRMSCGGGTPPVIPKNPTPVSRVQIGPHKSEVSLASDRPLDRSALVRPVRTSVHIPDVTTNSNTCDNSSHVNSSPPVNEVSLQMFRGNNGVMQQVPVDLPNLSHPANSSHQQISSPQMMQHQRKYKSCNNSIQQHPDIMPFGQLPPREENVVPMNMDKPTGLELDEFLPRKFSGLGFNYNTNSEKSKFSSYSDYGGPGTPQTGELSESEVTSSVLKGHDAMMAVLTIRARNLEIIQKMWQGKDAKAAVDQAVSLNDQAIMVDFLSVISLRPSIWNLDLCESLLPPIGELMQSKYELYINVACGAMKLILKNFASVIKSNIDAPIQTVGVDISREERHRKCMQCYKDLVKIRSLILKRQSIQGKLGHTFRELAILMQYLD